MFIFMRAALFTGGLLFVLLGIGFLLDPAANGADFALAPVGAEGLATIRADMTAFFVVAGGCMLWGAWKRNGDLLLVSSALFAIAFIGRAINAVAVGTYDDWWIPMSVEALAVVVTLVGSRVLPHRALT